LLGLVRLFRRARRAPWRGIRARASLFAFLILVGAALIGERLLAALGISMAAFRVAATLLLAGRAQGDYFSLALLIAAIALVALICFGARLAATRIERALGASGALVLAKCSACCCRRSPCNISSTAFARR
jgi:small neutral amino acid transporter SnatA (MarC family)